MSRGELKLLKLRGRKSWIECVRSGIKMNDLQVESDQYREI